MVDKEVGDNTEYFIENRVPAITCSETTARIITANLAHTPTLKPPAAGLFVISMREPEPAGRKNKNELPHILLSTYISGLYEGMRGYIQTDNIRLCFST